MPRTKLKLALICAFGLAVSTASAQDYKLSCLTYDWDKNPVVYVADSAVRANATVVLLSKKINEYRFNDKTKELELYYCAHTIKYVNDNKSIEDNNKIYVATGREQSLVTVKSRVINNGKIVSEASEKDFVQVEEEGRKYNMLAVKGLEKGFIVETITITKIDGFELYDDEYFQGDAPVKQAEFYLIAPGHTDFKCKGYNNFGAIKDSILDERHIYYGISKDIPAMNADETYSLLNANKQRVEFVYLQNNNTKKMNAKWPELGRIFFDRMSANYDKNQKDLDKVLSKMELKNAKSEAEKIFMIENYLKTNISVDSDADDAPTFAETFKRKVAGPFRFNQIMAQAYRKAGINIEYVLTCDKGYKRFDPDLDSWSYLRNVLFYVPSLKKYIDPGQPLKRVGSINSDYLGQSGLFVKLVEIGDVVSATASVKTIAPNDVAQSADIEKYTARFTPDLTKLVIDYNREMNGYAEQGIKALYFVVNDEKKKEFIEGFVKGLAKDAKVEDLVVENYNPGNYEEVNKPLVVKAKLTADHYVEPVGDTKILLKIGEMIGQQSEMYQDKPRFTPVDIDFAHSYQRLITITIPDGYEVKGLNALNINYAYNNDKGEPSFGFISSYKQEGNQLIVTCNEYYNHLYYPLSQFTDFKKVINAAADFNKITILFEKK